LREREREIEREREREKERAEDWERRCRFLNLLAFFFLFPSVSPLFLFPLSKSKATPLLLATSFRVCVFCQLNEQWRERQQRAAEEERRSVVSKKKKRKEKNPALLLQPSRSFSLPLSLSFPLRGLKCSAMLAHRAPFLLSTSPSPPATTTATSASKKKEKKRNTSGPHHCRRGSFWLLFLFIPIHAFRSLQLCSETQTPTVPPKTSASS
jgi:hypothetical protein